MARLLTQFFCIPAPEITEQSCPDQTGRVCCTCLLLLALLTKSCQTFIVTGGYAGLGFELSQILYAHNATVYIAGRSQSKASIATDRMKTTFPRSLGRLEFICIDLSDLSTIKPAVEAFLAREQRLDVLVNNAGVRPAPLPIEDSVYTSLLTC